MNHFPERIHPKAKRRDFIRSAGTAGLCAFASGTLGGGWLRRGGDAGRGSQPAPMSPNEDLMQEHALLSRVLLVYEEAIRLLEGQKDPDPESLNRSAEIIQHFVEGYHERLEEDYVFPRFEKAGKLVELVTVLREQHKAGRNLTQSIIGLSTAAAFKNSSERKTLASLLSSFIRMYQPHKSREGSVLFPAFRDLLPSQEFEELGDLFEKKEHELLGAEGFEGQVRAVAGLEKQLGIYELSQYTPR